jgi:hypothetical protein
MPASDPSGDGLMNPTEQASQVCCDYFVDEAGDGTLFDRKGRIIVGMAGCSRFFILVGRVLLTEEAADGSGFGRRAGDIGSFQLR